MASVTVRKLDEEVVSRLKRRAARNNRSLEGEVRDILEKATGDEVDMEEKRRMFIEMSDKMLKMTRGTKQTPSEVIIREMRDAADRGLTDATSSRC